ncbi:hypothetical protein HAX54_018002 [Datura stramonium]|uniref:Uncharacterized protein n=1 Tax=Datura stramonium TaxID=4076 RepID=A0ABS8UNN3_DATST|nr:hypothetical protein [Datura stramonium]
MEQTNEEMQLSSNQEKPIEIEREAGGHSNFRSRKEQKKKARIEEGSGKWGEKVEKEIGIEDDLIEHTTGEQGRESVEQDGLEGRKKQLSGVVSESQIVPQSLNIILHEIVSHANGTSLEKGIESEAQGNVEREEKNYH